MSDPSGAGVSDLYVIWRERRDAGQPISPGALCAEQGCPELVSSLIDWIVAVSHVEERLPDPETRKPEQTGPSPDVSTASYAPGRVTIPGFTILEELGRGGMGVVYKAMQASLDRLVALKMIRTGPKADAAEQARFMAEARAVANLHHENIVQIFDVGQHEGQLYFFMEFAEGGSLAAHLRGTPWPAQKAAALVLALARGLEHAHQRGIIHRDLKPGNVFLSADGTPKIGDFGLAKWLHGQEKLTQSGAILGTPAYMAPEQAAGSAQQVGPAADIYALGLILYELVCGTSPFRGKDTAEFLRCVRAGDIVPPGQIVDDLPRGLEAICLRCLRKNPADRYPSAAALADDLRAFLVPHRPASQLPRLAVAGVLMLLLIGAVWLGQSAPPKDGGPAETVVSVSAATQSPVDGKPPPPPAPVKGATSDPPPTGAGTSHPPPPQEDKKVIAPPEKVGEIRRFDSNTGPVNFVAFAPDGRSAISGSRDLHLWDVAGGKELRKLAGHEGPIVSAAFSPDGERILTSCKDGGNNGGCVMRLWEVSSGREAARFRHNPTAPVLTPAIVNIAFVPNTPFLLSGNNRDGYASVWDVSTDKPVRRLGPDDLKSVAVSPDGKFILTGGQYGAIKIWDFGTGKELAKVGQHRNAALCIAVSQDGRRAMSGTGGRVMSTACEIRVWNLVARSEAYLFQGHSADVNSVAVSADGTLGLSGSTDRTVRLWGLSGGKSKDGQTIGIGELHCFKDHTGAVRSVALSPDGRFALSGSDDGTMRLWGLPK